MKRRLLISIIISLSLWSAILIPAIALPMLAGEVETQHNAAPECVTLTPNKAKDLWTRFGVKENDRETRCLGIQNFAISEKGKAAVLLRGQINVYSEAGDHLCGFSFRSDGAEAVGWSGEDILLISKSGMAVIFSLDGEPVDAVMYSDVPGLSALEHELRRDHKRINGKAYAVKEIPFIYQELLCTDAVGNSHTIYSSSVWYAVINLLLFLGLQAFSVFVIYKIMAGIWKKAQEMKNQATPSD